MRTKTKPSYISGSVIVLFAVTVILVCFSLALSFNDKEYTITVTDKERIVENDNGKVSSKYLVFGESKNGEILVFQNSDDWLRGKWNSSTIQGSLKEGNTYKVVVVGYRIPFLSMYENIISFEELEGDGKNEN